MNLLRLCCVIAWMTGWCFTCLGDDFSSEFQSIGFDTSRFEKEFQSFRNPRKSVAPTAKTEEIDGGLYVALPKREKRRLMRLARCANAAYPGTEIPKGYRPFSEEEWTRCMLLRFSDDGSYNKDGYLNYASGLRARLMVNEMSGDVVVAWSGCDFPTDIKGSAVDIGAAIRQYCGKMSGQFAQALKIFQRILVTMQGRIEVVGHSLGGALTTYVVAASSDIDNRITGVTFNGLGLSKAVQRKLTDEQRCKVEKLLVNVKGTQDLVFKLGWARHYGPSYEVPQDCGIHWLKAHSIETLMGQMESLASDSAGKSFWDNISF